MKRLLAAPHRLFFFAAVVQLLMASAWWTWTLAARTRGLPAPLAAGLEPARVHAALMLYGFFPLFIFGFLFTAAPKWLERADPLPREYVAQGLLAAAGAWALLPAFALGARAAAGAAGLLLAAWLWMLARLVALIAGSRSADRLHAVAAAWALAAGGTGLAAAVAWLLTGSEAAARAFELAGLWGFLVPLFCAVSHRMIPFVATNALPFLRPWQPTWTLAVLAGGSIAHGLLAAAGLAAWLWIVDAPLAALVFFIARRWGLARSLRHRLLAMLQAGFCWLGVAWLLAAAQSLLLLAGVGALGLAPVHALTIGFLSTLTLAMVSRVSSGHSGRVVAHDALTWHVFLLLQAAAVVRVAADIYVAAYGALLVAAALLWLGGFAAWAWRYLPYYWRPRADGKPG